MKLAPAASVTLNPQPEPSAPIVVVAPVEATPVIAETPIVETPIMVVAPVAAASVSADSAEPAPSFVEAPAPAQEQPVAGA